MTLYVIGVFQAYGLTWGDSPQTPIDIFLQTIASTPL